MYHALGVKALLPSRLADSVNPKDIRVSFLKKQSTALSFVLAYPGIPYYRRGQSVGLASIINVWILPASGKSLASYCFILASTSFFRSSLVTFLLFVDIEVSFRD